MNIAGESAGRTLTARTLQGLVNRDAARLYLIDGGDSGAQPLLDRYVDRGLVTLAGSTNLDGALDLFASEVGGYVLADPDEPWSVHGATVIASLNDAIVTTADQVAALESRGINEIDDTRGRWPDAVTAYEHLADTYGDLLPSDTVAVVRPSDTLWDFVLQQGLLPVFTRPNDPSWDDVQPLLDEIPAGSPVYGYLSDTGEEEAIAVAALAVRDLVLVPTDTTRNLSFHIAVGADQPRVPAPTPALDEVEPCTTDELNVVVALTDGDNMNVPLNHFLRPTNWDDPDRGDLALGWSIGPDLAVLAPAAWDTYALEATGRDELVAMIGWGYGAPALMTDPADFYSASFSLMEELEMRTFWSLGGGLDTPTSSYWDDLDSAAGTGPPDGVLVGYGNATGSAFYSPAGRPAFTSRSVYSETPAQIAQHVTDLLTTPADQRPLVSFLSATNWSNPAGALLDALTPFEDQGVRFLTPAEAAACVPPAPEPPPPPEPEPETCLPVGPVAQHGLALISDPTASEVGQQATPFALPTEVEATPSITAGEVIDYTATITVDADAFAQSTLDERVRPIIAAGYGPELAASAWLTLRFEPLTVRFPLPAGTMPAGSPTASSTGAAVAASFDGDEVVVEIPTLEADSRVPGDELDVTISWATNTLVDADAFTATLVPGPVAFGLMLDIGVMLGDIPLTGGVTASWTCRAGEGTLASTAVEAAPDGPEPTPSTTTSTTTSTSTPGSTGAGAHPGTLPSTIPARPAPLVSGPARPIPVQPDFTG